MHSHNIQSELPSVDDIGGMKQQLRASYEEQEKKLKAAYIKAENNLDMYLQKRTEHEELVKQLHDLNVSQTGFNLFHSLAERRKQEDTYLLSNAGARSHFKYVEKTEEIISEMGTITSKFTELLEFLDIPPIAINTFIHYWRNDTLTIFDTLHINTKTYTLKTLVKDSAESIMCHDKIFFIGGREYKDGPPVNDTQEFNETDNQLVGKSNMLTKKFGHSLCSNDLIIYSIGGIDGTFTLSDCAKYDISQNKWESFGNLSTARHYCAAFTFNKKFIYAAGGYTNLTSLNTFERIHISTLKLWEVITFANPFTARGHIQGIQIKADGVLIFGGSTNESYLLKINESSHTCLKHCELAAGTPAFYNTSAPINNKKFIFGVSCDLQRHRYSIENQSWSLLQNT